MDVDQFVPPTFRSERRASEERERQRREHEELRGELVIRTFGRPESRSSLPAATFDDVIMTIAREREMFYLRHAPVSFYMPLLPLPLAPPPLPRPARPRPSEDIGNGFGIDADKMNLIRTKEVVGALTFIAQHDPSFSPEQQKRVHALAAELDRYGCGLARYMRLDERNAEGWIRRLEGLVASTIEADTAKPQEIEPPTRCPMKEKVGAAPAHSP